MKAHAIIQARFGAIRLPGKVLLKVMDKTILEYAVERVKKSKAIEDIVVATTTKESDLPIANLVSRLNIKLYRGSEDDVLDRYYQAAKLFKIQHIARITADCPLLDPGIISDVVHCYFKNKADYCSNTLEETFPDGEDVEVFSFDALEYAWKNSSLLSEREHVTPYLKKHPEKFKLINFKNKENLSKKRWTLDTEADFKLIKTILESLYPINPNFDMGDILKFLKLNPELEELNKNIIRNEGYLKSLKEDKILGTKQRNK
ncbi:MAG: glycosyltransferase family protein [Candidatus Omnitrophica bacterium]|nr:glycosyltransferase family protein [Candidatus Omnitrophota bacterium]